MADERTPEQAAADDALTAALEANIAAYHGDMGVVGEYLILWRSSELEPDGEMRSLVGVLPRDNDVPLDRQLGLLRYATVRIEKRVWAD